MKTTHTRTVCVWWCFGEKWAKSTRIMPMHMDVKMCFFLCQRSRAQVCQRKQCQFTCTTCAIMRSFSVRCVWECRQNKERNMATESKGNKVTTIREKDETNEEIFVLLTIMSDNAKKTKRKTFCTFQIVRSTYLVCVQIYHRTHWLLKPYKKEQSMKSHCPLRRTDDCVNFVIQFLPRIYTQTPGIVHARNSNETGSWILSFNSAA